MQNDIEFESQKRSETLAAIFLSQKITAEEWNVRRMSEISSQDIHSELSSVSFEEHDKIKAIPKAQLELEKSRIQSYVQGNYQATQCHEVKRRESLLNSLKYENVAVLSS